MNKYTGGIFTNDLIKEVFNIKLTAKNYENIGGIICSRNIFANCIRRNSKYLNDTYIIALKTLILEEIKDNEKKTKFLNYIEKHFPDIKDIREENVETIVKQVLSKFTCHEDHNDSIKTTIEPIIKEIEELYIKIFNYIHTDKVITVSLIQRVIENITIYIIEKENLSFAKKKSINAISYKSIMPKLIITIIENLKSLLNVKIDQALENDLKELIFINTRKIIQWFFKDYLNKPLYFNFIDDKAEKAFLKENLDDCNIKVYDVYYLTKNLGWSLEKLSRKLDELIYSTMNIESPTSDEVFISRIVSHPETRKFLLDGDKLIGYWNFMPLRKDIYLKDKEGLLDSNDLTSDKMPEMIPGEYYITFGSTFLHNDYRQMSVINKLLSSIIEFIEKLALNDIFIKEFSTHACTDNGKSFCDTIGMKLYKRHPSEKNVDIYYARIIDLINKRFLRDFELLKALYRKEYKDIC